MRAVVRAHVSDKTLLLQPHSRTALEQSDDPESQPAHLAQPRDSSEPDPVSRFLSAMKSTACPDSLSGLRVHRWRVSHWLLVSAPKQATTAMAFILIR